MCEVDSDVELHHGLSSSSSDCSCEGALHARRRDAYKEPTASHAVQTNDRCPSEPGLKQSHRSMSRTQFTDERTQSRVRLDLQGFPSLDPVVQQEIIRKYRALHQQIRDDGLYNCPYLDYGKELARYVALFAAFLFALRFGHHILSAIFLGLFWVRSSILPSHPDSQANFLASNHVHCARRRAFGYHLTFRCGHPDCNVRRRLLLWLVYWVVEEQSQCSPSRHKPAGKLCLQPNTRTGSAYLTPAKEHDPDIQNVPLFATCPSFFRSIHSSYYDFTFAWDAVAEIMVPYQRYTYYPVMGIARFNLYLLSWLHVLSAKSSALGSSKAWWIRPTEISFMCCYWFLFGYCLVWRTLPTWTIRVAFVLVSHTITMPLHVQITLSHWGMSTAELGESESFPQRQLRTTMDVDCPAWLDFIHGGLQFQAVHHLFPRVPRHNLRKAQVLTRQFCQETEIPYSILGFVDGNRKVLDRLQEVGDQVKILVNCQKYMAETGESGLH